MPGHPQLSASMNLKKGPIWGPFYYQEWRLGIRTLKKGGILSDASFQWAYYSCALHLGRLGDGLAFCREWAVVDATAQAIKLHKEPFNGIRPCAFLVGN